MKLLTWLFLLICSLSIFGCADKLIDLRDAVNDVPGLEWVIPDNVTEEYIGNIEQTLDRVTGSIDDHADLFTAGELNDFGALKQTLTGAIAQYREAMRDNDPEAMAGPEMILRDTLPRLEALWREGAQRYIRQRFAERIGGAG